MSIFAPLMNPVRFYGNLQPDYSNYFPHNDNVTQRVQWIDGIYATQFYKDWIVNKEISMQFASTTEVNMTVYKPNGTTQTITPTEITPAGWVSQDVYKYNYTPPQPGVYYFTIGIYTSDKIVVHSATKFKRRLIEIDYENSYNDYNMVFYNGAQLKYTGKTYFTGQLKTSAPENDISAFISDRGKVVKTRATPVRVSNLILTDIHYTLQDHINTVFSCDTLMVNGVDFQNSEVLTPEEIGKSDLVNITIKLTQTNNNYYVNL